MTMACIIFVNPSILKGAGMPPAAGTVATCLSAALGSILMGAYARYPIALAPGMGLSVYFAYMVVQGMGVDWRVALGGVVAHPNLSSHRPPQARNVERSLQASRCAGGTGNGDRGGQVPEAVKLKQDVDGAAEGVAQPPHRRKLSSIPAGVMYCPPKRRPAASKGNILMAWTPWLSISPRMIRTGSFRSPSRGRCCRPGCDVHGGRGCGGLVTGPCAGSRRQRSADPSSRYPRLA
jgi:hypothetical protein